MKEETKKKEEKQMKETRQKKEQASMNKEQASMNKEQASMNKEQTTMKKGERRKQALLKIAYEMFLTKGYENTSVDEIIEKAEIAKGTYYYYFESKEQMLEEVIGMMIEAEEEKARMILGADIPVQQKLVGVIGSFRPETGEMEISDALHRPENIIMHEKINERLMTAIVPLLSEIVEEGVRDGIFACGDIPERVKVIMVVATELFNSDSVSEADVRVFIDMLEKVLYAAPGSMAFVAGLIAQGEHHE